MGGRLDPVETQAQPPAAVEVKPNAAVEVKRLTAHQRKLRRLQWREGGMPPGPDATEAQKNTYKNYYASQTTTNGCSVPGVGIAQEGSAVAGYRERANVAACNEHDVAYGRGGSDADRKAADDQLFRKIEANGQPVRAWVTYAGVRVFGGLFFTERYGGPLPISEGRRRNIPSPTRMLFMTSWAPARPGWATPRSASGSRKSTRRTRWSCSSSGTASPRQRMRSPCSVTCPSLPS